MFDNEKYYKIDLMSKKPLKADFLPGGLFQRAFYF